MTNTMTAAPAPDVPPAHHLLAMMFGHAQTHLICVAAQLRLADSLQGGPQPLAALAQTTGTDAAALARVLQALFASAGLRLSRTIGTRSTLRLTEGIPR